MRRRRSLTGALLLSVALPLAGAAQPAQTAKPAPPAKQTQPAKAPAPAQAAQPLPRSEARERNLRAYVELLRSDLRTQKVALITEMMQFSEAEDTAFWPVYREYELELSRLNDERLRLFETYSKTYDKLTDALADDLMMKVLDLEGRRAALKEKYYAKLKTAVSPLTAAKALQIENQIQLLVDLQVAASLPVVQ